MRMPEINERVFVLVSNPDRKVPSRVEELPGNDTLAITPPSENGIGVDFAIGQPITIQWTNERGLLEGEGFVMAYAETGLPLLYIRLDSSRVAQRRDHVRVETVVDIQLKQASAAPVKCKTVDLSGGGMRAFVPLDLVAGEQLDAIVWVTENGKTREIELTAQVIRGTEMTGYAFRFLEVETADQEFLIRYVFAAHRREYAMRRSA